MSPPVTTAEAALDPAPVLLDPSLLSEVVQAPVRAVRLRHKPGLSTTGVLLDAAQDTVLGWVQVTHCRQRDKVDNAVRRASERGHRVRVRRVPGRDDLRLMHGPVSTDPGLHRGLDALTPAACQPEGPAACPPDSEEIGHRMRVLAYNPHRRLVLRRVEPGRADVVLRVTAEKARSVPRALRSLADRGVPVLRPVTDPGVRATRRLTVWPWFGIGDLTADLTPSLRSQAATAAGAALLAVHQHESELTGRRLTPNQMGAGFDPVRRDLRQLDPALGERMGRSIVRVQHGLAAGEQWREAGPSHGDFSADQVLVDADGAIRLIDFDRLVLAPPGLDLGTFAAVEMLRTPSAAEHPEDLTARVLSGYRDGGGRVPEPEACRAWTARGLLLRVLDPFRAAEPDWRARIGDRLERIEAVLAR